LLVMSGDFKRLIRGFIREAIIASSPKPKRAKKIKQKTRITQKNSRHIPKAIRVDVLRRRAISFSKSQRINSQSDSPSPFKRTLVLSQEIHFLVHYDRNEIALIKTG
jgi:hypothetical protein